MRKSNESMNKWLNAIQGKKHIGYIESKIVRRFNANNEPYFCIHPGWCLGQYKVVKEREWELTALEWEGNEIYLSGEPILELLLQGLKLIEIWKKQVVQEFREHHFDIVLSIDEGIEGKEETILPSVTIRLTAIRDEKHYIEDVQSVVQPVLIEMI